MSLPLGLHSPQGGVVAAFVFVFVSVFSAFVGLLCRRFAVVRLWPGLIGSAATSLSSATLDAAVHSTPRSFAGFVFRPGWVLPSSSAISPLVQSGFRHHPLQASSLISSSTLEILGIASPRIVVRCALCPATLPPVHLSSVCCLSTSPIAQIRPASMIRPVWIYFETFGPSRVDAPHKSSRADTQIVYRRANTSAESCLFLSRARLRAESGYPTLLHNAPLVSVPSIHPWNPGILKEPTPRLKMGESCVCFMMFSVYQASRRDDTPTRLGE